MTFLWHHSHKKQKDSLETQTVYIEIYLTSWNLLNIPKRRGSNLRNIASSEGSHLVAGAFHVIMDKIEADILQIAKKWNWKWIVRHQAYFSERYPAMNSSFAPKYVHLQGCSLKFGQNIKMFQPKYWNEMQEQTQVVKD